VRFESAVNEDQGIVLVAHVVKDKVSDEHKITLSSGFAVQLPGEGDGSVIVTCAHTLEEVSAPSGQ
jgi:hypothetical protein